MSLFASEKSKGRTFLFRKQSIPIQTLQPGCFKGIDIAFFSAGGKISAQWAEQAVQENCTVIDNSSYFRMREDIPLIVPEINSHVLNSHHKLIANPNCSTIQMCLVLNPLQKAFGLQSVQTATYQSASGAGMQAMNQLKTETQLCLEDKNLSSSRAFNCQPFIGKIMDDGFSEEDIKMQKETHKILQDFSIDVTAFTVRVPTLTSHGEAVWVHLKKQPQNREALIQVLKTQEGLTVIEDIKTGPDNQMASGTHPVYVGRIHSSPKNPLVWLMWICADNVLKGAALNGLQIAQHLIHTYND